MNETRAKKLNAYLDREEKAIKRMLGYIAQGMATNSLEVVATERKDSGKTVAILCLRSEVEHEDVVEVDMIPIAELIVGVPFENYNPPGVNEGEIKELMTKGNRKGEYTGHRPLYLIAAEIREDWKNVYFGAEPYLKAMENLITIKEKYFNDTAADVVRYFLGNAQSWKGEKAREIKKELNDALKAISK